ncbi:MAG TPA: hypothetical protein VMW08_00215 [Acidimicrobiales bacterium]|nr:hypothetical protein [Acidimicrobiales bacterium]
MAAHTSDDPELDALLEGVMPGLVFPTDGLPLPPEPSAGDVQKLLAATDSELAETTRDYYRARRAKALAVIRWNQHLDRTLVNLANASPERRGAQADREALARRTRLNRDSEEMGDSLWRASIILEEHVEAVKEHLYSVRARYSGLQSLLRSVVDIPL